LESIAYQTYDVLKAMESDSNINLKSLKVDGGACANRFLMQFQADILNTRVHKPECIETTALGAAYLAGLAVGVWNNKEDLVQNWKLDTRFEPAMPAEQSGKYYKGCKKPLNAQWTAKTKVNTKF
jgi:glycerol kinase